LLVNLVRGRDPHTNFVLITFILHFSEFISQLKEFELLHLRYRTRGLAIVALPSHDFGNEFSTDKEIEIV
jgi:glutathione peroxidase-family protein